MTYFIFRNSTIEPLFTDFNAIFSGYGDVTIGMSDVDYFIWFYLLDLKSDIDSLVDEIDDYYHKIELLLTKIPDSKPLIIFTIEKFNRSRLVNNDFILDEAIYNFNKKIFSLDVKYPNVKIIEISEFISKFRQNELIDWKFYYTSDIILNPKLKLYFNDWFTKKINAINFIRKKCIVLDLDNTLWGGILGEDNVEGILLGNTYPGSAYSDFQKLLLEIQKKGVILTVCSKNNKVDVDEAWEKNPFMILKKEHFSAFRINWKDKVSNILEIADELNIGLDSMVFLDDDPSERELVSKSIPEVIVPELPKQPYLLTDFLLNLYEQYFQVYQLTEEDKNKTQHYLAQKKGKEYKSTFKSYDDYLRNLEIHTQIQNASKFNIPRIAQLTQKTNQFNLTTKRYSEKNISDFVINNHFVACMTIKDKFGDYGITACAVVLINNDEAEIDTFLLSCRILGKGYENVFISGLLNELIDKGIKKVKAEFRQSNKNMQTENFYDNFGFKLDSINNGIKNYHFICGEKIIIKDLYNLEII